MCGFLVWVCQEVWFESGWACVCVFGEVINVGVGYGRFVEC